MVGLWFDFLVGKRFVLLGMYGVMNLDKIGYVKHVKTDVNVYHDSLIIVGEARNNALRNQNLSAESR